MSENIIIMYMNKFYFFYTWLTYKPISVVVVVVVVVCVLQKKNQQSINQT